MKNVLSDAFLRYLKPHGFRANRGEYFRSLPDVWQIVSLTRDFSWANRYSVTLGVYVKSVEEKEVCPRERFSHIRCGAQKVLQEDGDEFRYKTMDLSVDMESVERDLKIGHFVQLAINDFFLVCQDISHIADAAQKGYFSDVMFHRKLRDFLAKKDRTGM